MTKTQSKSPSCVWVSPSAIGERLDASYFHHEYISLDSSLAHFPKRNVVALGRCLVNPRRVLYEKTTSFSADEAPEGAVPFISGVDLDGSTMTINWSSVRYVERWMLDRYPKGRLTDGSLLIKVKGPNQHTAFVTKARGIALVSGTVFFSQVRGCNPFYLAGYLSSRQGTAWRSRLRTNTTVEFIGNEELRAVPVPLPDRRVQDYIGAKIELAERCRSRSLALRDGAAGDLAAKWRWSNDLSGSVRQNRPSAVAHMVEPKVFDDRLDPEFYRPGFLAVEKWLDAQVCWHLSELVESPVKGMQPSYDPEGTVPALTVTHVDPFVLDRSGATGFVTHAWLSQNDRARIERGEILYTVTGPPLGETVVVEDFHLPAAVNSHVARVRLRPEFKFPHLLAAMLNSPLGQMQTTRYSKGIRQKELYPCDFIRFRFPKLPSAVCNRLEKQFGASCRLLESARALVEEAKANVEALIDGSLDVHAILTKKVKAPAADDIPELAEKHV